MIAAERQRVLLIDDHPIVREGLAAVVGQTEDLMVCGEASGASLARQLASMVEPHVALVDIALGRDSGLDLIRSLREQHPELRLLAISLHDEHLFAERALKMGANGYVMKVEPPEVLLTAIRHVLAGRLYLSPAVSARLLESYVRYGASARAPSGVDSLSDRELDVFRLIGMGVSTRETADQLSLSIKTIESHRAKIKEKLGIHSASELVVRAVHWLEEQSEQARRGA